MKPNLYIFDDYREFLKELYSFLKNEKNSTSYRFLSKKGGFSSPNFLQLVLAGKRNLSFQSIPKVIQAFGLNKEEGAFFENLVLFNQAKSTEEKSRFFRQMAKSRQFRKHMQLEQDQFEYFSHWYYLAIREMLSLKDFREDPVWISEKLQPSVTLRQVKSALETLERLGLIGRSKEGKLYAKEATVTSGDEPISVAVRSFHQQMGKIAIESIDRFLPAQRDISGAMFSVPENQVQEIKGRIQEFRKEILDLVEKECDSGQQLYQLNVQFFPLTKKARTKK